MNRKKGDFITAYQYPNKDKGIMCFAPITRTPLEQLYGDIQPRPEKHIFGQIPSNERSALYFDIELDKNESNDLTVHNIRIDENEIVFNFIDLLIS